MSIQEFADGVAFLASRSPLFGGKTLVVSLIANPKAGGFTRLGVFSKHLAEMEALRKRVSPLPARSAPTRFRFFPTKRAGHAVRITEELIAESRADTAAEHLVIMAGGDGTSLEVLSTLMDLDGVERSRFVTLRLPMGTGNDGADARELPAALSLLQGPSRFESQAAIRVTPATAGKPGGQGPWWSFNIVSIGVDAFVSNMTNRLKTSLPGDSYKLWVDLSTVFYDMLWPTKGFHIQAADESGRVVRSFRRDMLLIAMGVSGRRTYGSNKVILPDDDNVCFVSAASLLRKLAVKGPLTKGTHRGFPEVDIFSASRVEIGFQDRALIQLDGEVYRLGPADFPVVFERTEPVIRLIRKMDAPQ